MLDSSHLVHPILLNTKFPSKPLSRIRLGGVLLHLGHVVVTHSPLDARGTSKNKFSL